MRTPPRLHLAPSRPLNLNGDGQVANEGMDALQNERISAAEATDRCISIDLLACCAWVEGI
jgi:hypothetical protein